MSEYKELTDVEIREIYKRMNESIIEKNIDKNDELIEKPLVLPV